MYIYCKYFFLNVLFCLESLNRVIFKTHLEHSFSLSYIPEIHRCWNEYKTVIHAWDAYILLSVLFGKFVITQLFCSCCVKKTAVPVAVLFCIYGTIVKPGLSH